MVSIETPRCVCVCVQVCDMRLPRDELLLLLCVMPCHCRRVVF